jgi:predicted transcriptional regulator
MKILLHINDTQEEKLAEVARRLNVQPEELVTAAVEDFLARAEADFQAAANRVLEKNQELYRRLS